MKPFIPYGTLHAVIALISLAIAAGIYQYAGTVSQPQQRKRDSYIFLSLMAGIYLLLSVAKILGGWWTIQGNLPLHLCDISAWTMIYALFSRRQWAFEAGYYWGLTGELLALGVPNVTTIDFYLIPFFLWHTLLIGIPLYQLRSDGFRPTHRGIYRTMAITIGVALVVMGINEVLDSNYMFLSEKIPAMDTIGLPDYPYYLPLTVPMGIAIWYIFWGVSRKL